MNRFLSGAVVVGCCVPAVALGPGSRGRRSFSGSAWGPGRVRPDEQVLLPQDRFCCLAAGSRQPSPTQQDGDRKLKLAAAGSLRWRNFKMAAAGS
ncbi:hypothetical protein NDU88_000548 [Pleurodeles waltl]|uniref:Secreted protein n=1 Tax=Pleurodeles waltl TaxID=8319 RepID=A0AAV7KR09_PLEWA|nr:hypothetical protein NDU88_000548 [Pleurodeles waltl]